MEPFQCHMCNLWFARFSRYKRHVWRHRKKYVTLHRTNKLKGQFLTDLVKLHKPFKCGECPKNYARRSSLNEHYKMHHVTKVACLCLECGKSFMSQEELDDHAQTHVTEKAFQCPQCDKSFSHQATFTGHLKIHIGDMPFGCHLCDKAFTSKCYLRSHLKSHSEERAYKCDYCNNAYKHKSALNVHLKSHFIALEQLQKFKCPHCGRGFARKSSRNRHLLTHARATPFHCSLCGVGFGDKNSLLYHIALCTKAKLDQSLSPLTKDSSNHNPSGDKVLASEPVENLTNAFKAIPLHVAVKLTATCNPVKEFQDTQREQSIQPYEDNAPSVGVKAKVGHVGQKAKVGHVGQINLENHAKEHMVDVSDTGDVKSSPPLTSAKSISISDLVKDKALEHIENDQISTACINVKCPANVKSAIDQALSQGSANQPLVPEDSIDQCPTCPCCKKTFSTSNYLWDHLRTHTGEKPFHCQFCDKKFTQKFYLKVHLKSHSEEREFKCDHCGNSYKHKSALNAHLKNHYFAEEQLRKFKCPECGKGFARTTTLKRHILTHDGAKPLQCSQCKVFFTKQSALMIHQSMCKKANALASKTTLIAAAAHLSGSVPIPSSTVPIPGGTVFPYISQMNTGHVPSSTPNHGTTTAAILTATATSDRVKEQDGRTIAGEVTRDISIQASTLAQPVAPSVKVEESEIAHGVHIHGIGICSKPFDAHLEQTETQSNPIAANQTLNGESEKGDQSVVRKAIQNIPTPATSIVASLSTSTGGIVTEKNPATHQLLKPQNQIIQHHDALSSSVVTSFAAKPEKDETIHSAQLTTPSLTAASSTCSNSVIAEDQSSLPGSIPNTGPMLMYLLTTPAIAVTPIEISNTLKEGISNHPGIDSFLEKTSKNQCPFCGKSFTVKASLEGHLRIHTGEKPFHCHLCPKVFSQRIYLKSHLKIHSDERGYKCKQCSNTYKHRSSLNDHMKSHQFTDEELRNRKCPQCGKGFRRNTCLRRHILTHNANYNGSYT